METPKKIRPSIPLELFLDALLLLLFMAQAFIAANLLIYGYLPLPAEWGNRLLTHKTPQVLKATMAELRLRANGRFEFIGLEVHVDPIEQALFRADSAELALSMNGFALPLLESVVVSGGTFYTPAVYSPNGKHSPLLEKIALRIRPSEGSLKVDRFAALHEEIRLRGAFDIPDELPRSGPAIELAEMMRRFYTEAGRLRQQKERIGSLESPTIVFKTSSKSTQQLSVKLSSHELNLPEISGERIEMEFVLAWSEAELTTIQPPLLRASSLSIPKYQVRIEDLVAEIPTESVATVIEGRLPPMRLAARTLSALKYELDAPFLTLDPSALPQLQFTGSARSLDGAFSLQGHLNTDNWSGSIQAKGSIDLGKIAPQSLNGRIPEICFGHTPYFDLNVHFDENFSPKMTTLLADVKDVIIEDLHFDHIRAKGTYEDELYTINKLFLGRKEQWLDLKFRLNRAKDYRATVVGSAIPHDYNSIMPRWWEAIFREFDFSDIEYSRSDFIIYGNTGRRAADLYFGHTEARKVRYRDVLLDEGELIVRGRGPYTELHQLKARSGGGSAKGNISFFSKLDEVRSPASVRLDMEATLTLEDAGKLFGRRIAAIIGDFDTEALPITRLEGAIFNGAYPEYSGKSYFDIRAVCEEPISYKQVPLDYLNFMLYGRAGMTYLRDFEFGYANGIGRANIDVLTPKNGESSVRYALELVDANKNEAIQNLPRLDEIENSFETGIAESRTQPQREEARIDFKIKGSGPINNVLAHTGNGVFEMRSQKLGTLQLLGPLSKLLQNTQLNFTSFKLNQMGGSFRYQDELVTFDPLQIDGPLTQIRTPGTLNLKDQSLDMRVSVYLFRNVGDTESNIRKISELITKPIPNLLEFELTGTIQDQKLRSLYDPRNLIPRF
jgi:hypothetical protein